MSTRQQRYMELRTQGLYDKEAQEFSKIEFHDIPYFQEYLRDRRMMLLQWRADYQMEGLKRGSRRKYLDMVTSWYKNNNWMRGDKIDPWKAYRYYEKRWKDRNEDYVKPAYKRHKDIMNTEYKLRRSLGY